MTEREENQELLSTLLDIIDQLFATTQVQKAYLELFCQGEWEGPVTRALDALAPRYSAQLATLRDTLIGAPDGTFLDNNWRQAIDQLIESAKPNSQQ